MYSMLTGSEEKINSAEASFTKYFLYVIYSAFLHSHVEMIIIFMKGRLRALWLDLDYGDRPYVCVI